jgi:hypothetical protein
MRADTSFGRRVRVAAISVTAALVSAVLVAPSVNATVEPCTTPPEVFPIGNLTAGMTATGWTVLQGTTPESFQIEILGVLHDAIAPGYDLILVKASGANIDAIGGMGPGFSGSPVYRNGKLVGSVSYGLGGDAHYGALTPGQSLVDVMNEPGRSVAQRQSVRLSRADRRVIARDARVSVADVGSTLTEIPTPLAVTGASDARMQKAANRLAKAGSSVVPYRASASTSSGTVSSASVVPGGVFTAAISYGAISYAGIGTATIVCGDYVVAFGHSFRHTGGRPDGAALDGEVVATIPAGGFYDEPFKIANIGSLLGTVDQDRLSGIRGVLGPKPSLKTITSTVTNTDNGKTYHATTQVAVASWMRFIALDHTYSVLHGALDAHRGVARVTWTISGRNEGEPFSFDLSNVYAGSRVLFGPAYDVYLSLRSVMNATGTAHIRSVDINATVTETHDYGVIHKLRTQSTTEPGFDTRTSLTVHRGDTVDVRVPVQHALSGDTQFATASFVIPNSARGRGEVEAYASRGYFYVRNPGTLDQLIAKFAKLPRGNDLTIYLRMRGMNKALREVASMPWPLKGRPDGVQLRLAA